MNSMTANENTFYISASLPTTSPCAWASTSWTARTSPTSTSTARCRSSPRTPSSTRKRRRKLAIIFWQLDKWSEAGRAHFFASRFEYDLALLRFYDPVKFQPNVVPICVPEDDERLVGETAWVTGWGRLYEGQSVRGRLPQMQPDFVPNTYYCINFTRNDHYYMFFSILCHWILY